MMVDDGGADPAYEAVPQASPPLAEALTTDERLLVQIGRTTGLATLTVIGHGVDTGTDAAECSISAMALTT